MHVHCVALLDQPISVASFIVSDVTHTMGTLLASEANFSQKRRGYREIARAKLGLSTDAGEPRTAEVPLALGEKNHGLEWSRLTEWSA